MGRRPYRWRDAVMIQLWDGGRAPGRWISGLPAFRYGWAPDGLAHPPAVARQAAVSRRHEPYALLVWRRNSASPGSTASTSPNPPAPQPPTNKPHSPAR
jgi:hypothetical protein